MRKALYLFSRVNRVCNTSRLLLHSLTALPFPPSIQHRSGGWYAEGVFVLSPLRLARRLRIHFSGDVTDAPYRKFRPFRTTPDIKESHFLSINVHSGSLAALRKASSSRP